LAAIEAARIAAEVGNSVINAVQNQPPFNPQSPFLRLFAAANPNGLFSFSQDSTTFDVFLTPQQNRPTASMSYQALLSLMQQSGGIRMPLIAGLFMQFLGGGISLPGELEQEFFIAQR